MSECTSQDADRLMKDGLRSIPEAARFLTLSRGTIGNLMKSGELPFVKIGRSCRIPQRAIIELAARKLVVRGKSTE